MAHFSGEILLAPLPMRYGKRWYRLHESITYFSDRIKEPIIVPAGFETDMASVPIPFQPFIQKDDGPLWAALVHDYLYSKSCSVKVTRKEADEIFLEAMTITGVGPIKRGMVYHSVRWFAGHSWRKR